MILLVALSGCVSSGKAIKSKCTTANINNYVIGDGECLRIKTSNAMKNPQTLIVLIHGDGSGGGPSDYLAKQVHKINPEKNRFTVVTLIRPGYFDREGNYSTGSNYKRRDNYTAHNIDAIAAAIQKLKEVYEPNKVVVAGHSGGAAITGTIIGRHPSFIDGAVLAACPCNIGRWRAAKKRKPWRRSLSPASYVDKITGTKVVAIAGSADNNTFPELMSDYIESLQARGIAAKFHLLEGISHNGTARSKEFLSAIIELAK